MADNKDQQENLKIPEKEVVTPEQPERVELEKITEKQEIQKEDRIVSEELKREIEMMGLDDKTKKETEAKAEKIEFLGEKEKIEHLLEIARKKGVVFAIQVARKMNEPYLLDILHDTLAQEGYYKDFTK